MINKKHSKHDRPTSMSVIVQNNSSDKKNTPDIRISNAGKLPYGYIVNNNKMKQKSSKNKNYNFNQTEPTLKQ